MPQCSAWHFPSGLASPIYTKSIFPHCQAMSTAKGSRFMDVFIITWGEICYATRVHIMFTEYKRTTSTTSLINHNQLFLPFRPSELLKDQISPSELLRGQRTVASHAQTKTFMNSTQGLSDSRIIMTIVFVMSLMIKWSSYFHSMMYMIKMLKVF